MNTTTIVYCISLVVWPFVPFVIPGIILGIYTICKKIKEIL